MPSLLSPLLIIVLWLATVCAGFWWFEFRHWQTFLPVGVVFDGQNMSALYQHLNPHQSKVGQITVVHFANPNCPCHRYSEQHRKTLQPILKNSFQHLINPEMAKPLAIHIPASPAVAVWDEQGQLAYFGPYSSGNVCGSGKDFVENVVEKLQRDINPKWVNMLGVGCYCPWPVNKRMKEDQHA